MTNYNKGQMPTGTIIQMRREGKATSPAHKKQEEVRGRRNAAPRRDEKKKSPRREEKKKEPERKKEAVKPILTYFRARSRGEVPRLIMEDAGVEYDYADFTMAEWRDGLKDDLAPFLSFGQVPLYQDSLKLNVVQSQAINRYVARKYGYAGSTEREVVLIDMVAEGARDLLESSVKSRYFRPQEQRQAEIQKFAEGALNDWLNYYSDILEDNNGGKGYFVGDKVSYGDFCVYEVLVNLQGVKEWKDVIDMFPELKDWMKRVESRPKIKAYLASEPYKNK